MPSIFRPDLFAGQTVVITGGGTGIGRRVALELSGLGATVAICGRREEPLAAVEAEITDAGGTCIAQPCNIRDEESIAAFVGNVLERSERIDGLVNNGGGQFAAAAETISTKGFMAVVETNLLGTFQMTREVFQRSMGEHGGAIVSITMDNHDGYPGMAHSGASRAGVDNLTKSLAIEWAPKGVRINAIAPGIIRTSGLDTYPEFARDAIEQAAVEFSPYRRMGTEAEVSAAVTFLLSPGASFISGATLRVDGVESLWRKYWPVAEHTNSPAPVDDVL